MTKPRQDVDYLAVRISRFLMTITGFWAAENEKEKRQLNIIVTITMCIVFLSVWTEILEFYLSVGSFYTLTYTLCSAIPVGIILVKVVQFLRYRDVITELIRYTQDNFWRGKYDSFGKKVMQDTNRKAAVLICSFTFFVQLTCITYTMTPIFENVGKNESDRILPLRTWFFNIDLAFSPYFEIMYFVQSILLMHSGVCFCCFDNFLFLLNLNAAAQFKILQQRIETIYDRHYLALKGSHGEKSRHESVARELKECVEEHKNLICYMETLEELFAYVILCQLVTSSIILCVAGFQVSQAHGTLFRRLIFIAHTYGSFFQIFVITLSCDEVMGQSTEIGLAAYMAAWQVSSYEEHGKIRHNLRMIMRRARQPCCLTAGHFFPVNLETLKSVLSAAGSYFMLLRNVGEEISNS